MSLLDQAIAQTVNPVNTINPALPTQAANESNLETTTDFYGNKHELFTVEEHNLTSHYGTIPNKKGLFVNGQNINIVSDRYEVHQPKDIAKQFYNATQSQGLEVNRCIANPNNGGLLLSAKYSNQIVGGDSTDINLTFYTSHDGKYKTFLSLDTLRIACFNQLPILYKNKDRFIFAEKHYKNALDIERIGQFIAGIPASVGQHNDKLNALKETKLSLADLTDLFIEHYKLKKEQKQFQTKVDAFKSMYYNAPGQAIAPHNTAYKALQAITYRNTHEGRKTAMQEENRLIKGGNDSLEWLDNLLELSA